MTTASKYIMDDAREGQRLLDKADPSTWIDKFLASHFPHVKSILSVGCGPGVFLREIAEAHPEIEVVGVDISQKRITDAQKRLGALSNARACLGDALNLPFDANHFDLVFCRFLLEYLPDKPLAVREMKRVCKPGGKLLLQDLDGQLVWHFPEDDELQKTTERVVAHLAATGFDPFVGRKLFSLCVGGGLSDVKVQLDPYHLYAGTIDETQFSQWRTKLEIARPQIVAVLGDQQAAATYSERFLAYLKNPDTLTYSCLFTVTGTKAS
jgi:SAM-dependent methyltransferase